MDDSGEQEGQTVQGDFVEYVSPVEAIREGFQVEFYEVGVYGNVILEIVRYPDLDGESAVYLPRFSYVQDQNLDPSKAYSIHKEKDTARESLQELGVDYQEKKLEGEAKERLLRALEYGLDLVSATFLAFQKNLNPDEYKPNGDVESSVLVGVWGEAKSGKTSLISKLGGVKDITTFSFDRFQKENLSIDSEGVRPGLVPRLSSVLGELLEKYKKGDRPRLILAELVAVPPYMDLEADAYHRLVEGVEVYVHLNPFNGYVTVESSNLRRPFIFLSQVDLKNIIKSNFSIPSRETFIESLNKAAKAARQTRAMIINSLKETGPLKVI